MSTAVSDTAAPDAAELALPTQRGYWGTVGYRLRYDHVTLFFGALLLLIILAAVAAPLLAPFDPYQESIIRRLKPPGYQDRYWLGTDELGRDMLSRLLHGGRITLTMGILPVIIATLIGGSLGVLAGFAGGVVNMSIMRVMDVFYAFPSVLLAVAISGAMGGGAVNGMIALTLVFIPPLCRVAETATTQVRNLDFVDAARATGAPMHLVVRHHVIGNVLGPILIYASSLVSVAIILASGLSFLGLGVKPPDPDWGLMLNALRQAIYVSPLVAAMPGIAILITSISMNLVSDGLRAAMDVRS
ncbi:ABC transporter permease [Roseomonas hellenica]|uniref:ABC transporter permease n=1 Tax=Plastoroseomonas hellenica TaxID=2687306 RepID=A0ABS5F3I0_9PROT|nr:ABC transporter permease [Plastoroseomonas hellenica]MBR0667139.1 ABC transporter permease [Plastoroseomonas hellenica]